MRGEKEKEKNIVKVRDKEEREGGKLSKEMISERERKGEKHC